MPTMLWSLLVLSHVVLVTSQDLTWGQLPVTSLQWGSPSSMGREQAGQQDAEVLSKRALSVLSRWKPFHQVVNRFVARASNRLPPGQDFVSAHTRGTLRPVGQPLRWGR